MPDRDVFLHRVRGLVSGANWRETKFAAAVPPHLTCGLCRMIPPATVLLPCSHALCESCLYGCAGDGNDVCPFDAEPFAVGECPRFQLQAAASKKLRACCWNEARGCTFVGTLQAVLTHYEEDCTLHAVTCPRCNDPVLHQDLPRHYRAECNGEDITSAIGEPRLRQCGAVGAEEVERCLDELKALIRDPIQDRLPALQSTINEILEEARNIRIETEAVTRSCRESEQRVSQALGQLSTTFGRKLQAQETLLCAHLNEGFKITEISEQVMNHGMQINSIARTLSDSERRLSDQLAEATQELSTTFAQTFQSQRLELSAQLKQICEVEEGNPCEGGTTSTNKMPWTVENRHILRKLELVAADSIAYLELLRQRVDQQLKQPVVEYRPLFPDNIAGTAAMLPLLSDQKNEEEGYIVSLTNIYDVVKNEKFIGLFTRWYRRDRYLQVATYGWRHGSGQRLTLCLKWGTTHQGSCPLSHEAHVSIKHPDYPKKENLHLKRFSSVGSRAALFGFEENFVGNLTELERLGFVRDEKLTFVVSFKV